MMVYNQLIFPISFFNVVVAKKLSFGSAAQNGKTCSMGILGCDMVIFSFGLIQTISDGKLV